MELVSCPSYRCTISPKILSSQKGESKRSQFVFSSLRNTKKPSALSFSNVVTRDGYVGRGSSSSFSGSTVNNKIYQRLGSCPIIPPLNGKKPRAIIKFLGGAFIGAVPEVTYRFKFQVKFNPLPCYCFWVFVLILLVNYRVFVCFCAA